MSKFSDRITDLRLGMNLSLRQLSKLTGISPSAIHSYEIGKREASYKSLEALSDVFNCDIEYLLGKTDIKNSVASSFGVTSLSQLYKKSPPSPEPKLNEGEEALLNLFRLIPEDKQQMVLEMIRVALGTQG